MPGADQVKDKSAISHSVKMGKICGLKLGSQLTMFMLLDGI